MSSSLSSSLSPRTDQHDDVVDVMSCRRCQNKDVVSTSRRVDITSCRRCLRRRHVVSAPDVINIKSLSSSLSALDPVDISLSSSFSAPDVVENK